MFNADPLKINSIINIENLIGTRISLTFNILNNNL